MRHRLVPILCTIVAACGSPVTGVVTPPPPPAPGLPASVTIVSGDGQTAAPAAPLPVTLSVVVKDAAGTPVPGVVVHFAVDSGGGTVAPSDATTGSNGVASGVTWTLGAASSTGNVVTATVGTSTSTRFHAQSLGLTARPIFTQLAVPTGGGTFRYSHAGDGLDGLTLTVPAGAYKTATQWSIVADSTISVHLPAGVSLLGPPIVITNGQDYADSVISLTMPLKVPTGYIVAPFYLDRTSGTLETIPIVDMTSTYATLATRHFSGDLMALPSNGGVGTLRQSLRAGFGSVVIVWVAASPSQLAGSYATSFVPGIDDWEFINKGDFISPGGDCEGMSVTAMFYHFFIRGASLGKPLYHLYDKAIPDQWDNVRGIRFAGSVQGDYDARFNAGINQTRALVKAANARNVSLAAVMPSWIILTFKVTGKPVLISLEGSIGGHAVIAYAAQSNGTTTDVSFANPNDPGATDHAMTFSGGLMNPVPLANNGSFASGSFSLAIAVGVSANVPLNQVQSRWQEFAAGTPGADRYPRNYRFEIFDSLNNSWSTLGNTFTSTSGLVKLRMTCPDCPTAADSLQIWDGGGQNLVTRVGTIAGVVNTTLYDAVGFAFNPDPADSGLGFVDAQHFTFIHVPFSIQSSSVTPAIGAPVNFVAHNGGLGNASSTFGWTFGDGSGTVVVGDSAVTHAFTGNGSYTVTVQMRDGNGNTIGQATAVEILQPPPTATISPAPLNLTNGIVQTLTANVSGLLPPHPNFSWTFGDNSGLVNVLDSPTVLHTWSGPGIFQVTLAVLDSAKTGLIAQKSGTACVGTAWRFTAIKLDTSWAPPSGVPATYLTALADADARMQLLPATPGDGLLYLGDAPYFPEQGVYLQVGAGNGASGACWLNGGYLMPVSRVLGNGSAFNNVGPMTSGTITGSAFTQILTEPASAGNVFNNTIQATKTGASLDGRIFIGSNTWGGGRIYTFNALRLGQ